MGVLFMMPLWHSPSEVWMQRMMEELGDDLCTVVASNTGGKKTWRNRVRAISLEPNGPQLVRFYSFIQRRLKLTPLREVVLLKECRSRNITHILCHYGDRASSFADVWKKVDKPLFVHFHGYDATFDLRVEDQPGKNYFSPDYPAKIRELSLRATLIANSNLTKSWLVQAGVPSDRIVVKYLGVPVPAEPKIHTQKEETHIVQLGRLVDCKSPDRTIKAFELVRSKGLQAKLTIAGDGPLKIACELLKTRSPYKDSISLPGAITADQASELLSNADIYTQHNIQGEITRQVESFGLSVLEAMSAGLPIVGTRSGGVLETVKDGETGILVNPGSVEEQAEALLAFANNAALRQQFGDAGRKRVAEFFSMEQEASRLREIMKLPGYAIA